MVNTVFPKLRGTTMQPDAVRAQDNTDTVLRPVATALANTPIMGVAPVWTLLELNPLYANFGGTSAVAAYYKDALMRVWLKGVLTSAAGAPGGTVMATLPPGFRPREDQVKSVAGNGAYHALYMQQTGQIIDATGTGAGALVNVDFSFLADQ